MPVGLQTHRESHQLRFFIGLPISQLFLLRFVFVECRTALMLASLGRHTDCVHILLEKGAKADAADKKGFTALHRAVRELLVPCDFLRSLQC